MGLKFFQRINFMNKDRNQSNTGMGRWIRLFLFPFLILLIYGALFAVMPDKISVALMSSGRVFLHIIVPLSLVFILMVILNIFVNPASIIRFLGRGSGIKGIMLSLGAGIISMGPVYAWYPLLKGMREKGAMNSLIAIFINSRAVKPFLLPVMVAYFGLKFVIILTVFTITGSIIVGFITGMVTKGKEPEK